MKNGRDVANPEVNKLLPPTSKDIDSENLHTFFETMYERHRIWYRRNVLGLPQGEWTEDPIFKVNKFCNVYRELDRSSQFLIENVLVPWKGDNIANLLFRIIIYRFYNQPNSIVPHWAENNWDEWSDHIQLPHYDNYSAETLYEQTKSRRKHSSNPWHTAYLMNPAIRKPRSWNESEQGKFKDFVYCMKVFPAVYNMISDLTAAMGAGAMPDEICSIMEAVPAVASFMSHEFYLDFCYTTRYCIKEFFPWTEMDYTNVGPGASLGIRLIFPQLKTIKDQENGLRVLYNHAEHFLDNIAYRRDENFHYVQWNKKTNKYDITDKFNLTLHTIEFWLCEFQKYWKMKHGVGKQRSKFQQKTII